MATVAEAYRGESGDASSRTIDFIVTDATGTGNALTATSDYITTNYPGQVYDGLPLTNISSEEISYTKGCFKTVATFSNIGTSGFAASTNDIEISFDVNLDTLRIYRSYQTLASYNELGKTDDTLTPKPKDKYGGQINVTQDGTEGADVRIPVGGFQVTFYAPVATVTPTYRKTVLDMVGKVNNATFYGHASGEVMFSGVAGRQRNASDWELTFRFEVSPNQTNINIANLITVTEVEGWDLLWVEYFPKSKDIFDPGKVITLPKEAFVERIYERADFSALGIGTS